MRFIAILFLIGSALCFSGCSSSKADPYSDTTEATPTPKKANMTKEEYQKALQNNPNISPDVKKVIGGGGR